MQTWQPFRYKEQIFSLSHLNSTTNIYIRPPKGEKPAQKFNVRVIYTAHCFSRGLKKAEDVKTIDPELLFENPDKRGENRVFDFRRYALSKNLPRIIANLGTRPCYITDKNNFFTIEILNEPGNRIEYEVYFDIFPAKEERTLLILQVLSAYVRDEDYAIKQPQKKRMGFYIMLHKVANHQKIAISK